MCTFVVLAASVSFVSCGNDEPDNNESNGNTPVLVTASELVGTWTFVKDNVLYSEINSQKEDEVISYSGNSSPLYHFYKVTASEDKEITIVEVSVSGAVTGSPIKYTLKDNQLVNIIDGKVAGTIEYYDAKHSWDNLRIKWNKDSSPIQFGATVISTYML